MRDYRPYCTHNNVRPFFNFIPSPEMFFCYKAIQLIQETEFSSYDVKMLPEDIVLQLKRKGIFDDMRKQLLKDFQSGEAGTQFMEKLNSFIESRILEKPALLEKNSGSFYEDISSELEKSDFYTVLRDQVMETLKQNDYQQKIDSEIRAVTEKTSTEEQQL